MHAGGAGRARVRHEGKGVNIVVFVSVCAPWMVVDGGMEFGRLGAGIWRMVGVAVLEEARPQPTA